MSRDIVIIISCLAIFNLSLISVLSWLKSKNRPFNLWLGLMFFATVLAILDNTLIFIDREQIVFYHLAMIFNLSWGAYLIGFIRSLHQMDCPKIRVNPILFIPSFIYLPFLVLTLFNQDLIHDTLRLAKTGDMTVYGMFYNFIICIYTIFSNIYLLRKEYRTDESVSVEIRKGIKQILWLMLIMQLMAFVPFMLKLDVRFLILYMPVFGQLFFLYVFIRMTFSAYLFFDQSQITTKDLKYAAIKLDASKADDIYNKILSVFEIEKPYLQQDFCMKDLAKSLNISTNVLSMIINSRMKTSFPDLINIYRVNRAIQLLETNNSKKYTIDTICFESGFNNRTSFYNAFRKQTGKLPSEYMKKATPEDSLNNKQTE